MSQLMKDLILNDVRNVAMNENEIWESYLKIHPDDFIRFLGKDDPNGIQYRISYHTVDDYIKGLKRCTQYYRTDKLMKGNIPYSYFPFPEEILVREGRVDKDTLQELIKNGFEHYEKAKAEPEVRLRDIPHASFCNQILKCECKIISDNWEKHVRLHKMYWDVFNWKDGDTINTISSRVFSLKKKEEYKSINSKWNTSATENMLEDHKKPLPPCDRCRGHQMGSPCQCERNKQLRTQAFQRSLENNIKNNTPETCGECKQMNEKHPTNTNIHHPKYCHSLGWCECLDYYYDLFWRLFIADFILYREKEVKRIEQEKIEAQNKAEEEEKRKTEEALKQSDAYKALVEKMMKLEEQNQQLKKGMPISQDDNDKKSEHRKVEEST